MGERLWRTIDWCDVDRIERRFVPEQSDGEGTSAAYELIRSSVIAIGRARSRLALTSQTIGNMMTRAANHEGSNVVAK
jgi:hypothetical protein